MSMLYGGPLSWDGNTSSDTEIYVTRVCATRDEPGSVNSPPAVGQAITEATNVSTMGLRGRWELSLVEGISSRREYGRAAGTVGL
jgi:hypothetical protein